MAMTQTAASTKTLHVNGVDLAWSERGSSPPGTPTLVLVHGYTGSSHDFALQVDSLAENRRVVVLDQRGHGLSTKTGTLEGYSVEQLSRDLAAFLEAVGGGPVDLLGHSMGGRVVMTMAVQRPDLVRSLILMDTSAWSFQPDDEKIRTMVWDYITAFDPARGMPSTLSLGGPEDDLIAAGVPTVWQQQKDEIFTGMDAYAVKGLGMELWTEIPDADGSLRGRLGSITCPTTVLVGELDHPLVGQAPALTAELADGRLTVIAGAYHSPQLTHPEAWRGAVEAHLAAAAVPR
jgi:pimeloyl-ACP methyl ester carboxylesterase